MSVLVLGGGVSGLSTAYYLSKNISPSAISIWEASSRVGGWIKSERQETGILFEQSARTLRPKSETGANTLQLIDELNLSAQIKPILSTHPAAKNRMIIVNGQLHSLPSSLLSLFNRTAPFSKPLIKTFLKEYSVAKKKVKDESIYDFTKRRFGSEVADYLISPLICGICAGNAKEISVNFLMGQLFEYEQIYGSITKGIIFNLFSKKTEFDKPKLFKQALKEKWSVYSFQNGLETLPRTLYETINLKGIQVYLNNKCEKIEFSKNEIIVHSKSQSVNCHHLFSSLLSEHMSKLIVSEHPKLSELLNKIKGVNVAVVNLHFKGNLIKNPGFGFLVPPQENLPILGVIYDSCCFEQNGDTVLTVMMGGYFFDKYFKHFKSHQFYDVALKHVKSILNISEDPVFHKVRILEKCIPQYSVGHRDVVQKITDYIKDKQLPLSLCGMSYNGVGVNDVILSARKSVDNYFRSIV